MKKLTGPFLLAGALMIHMGIVVATEEDYTFSSEEYILPAGTESATTVNMVATTGSSLPISGISSLYRSGMYSIDEQSTPF